MKKLRVLSATFALCAWANLATSAEPVWLPTWYAAPTQSPAPDAAIGQLTLREIVHSTAGGEQLRVRLSNEFGKTPLHIQHAQVAHRLAGARTDGGVPLRFEGNTEVVIPAGASVQSDPVVLAVAAQSDLAISLYIDQGQASTAHLTNRSQIYFAHGDQVAQADLESTSGPQGTWGSWLFVSAVEVKTSDAKGTLIAFGDSITDGMQVEPDKGLSWPDRLHQRLRLQGLNFSVVNAGISGNRLNKAPQWPPFGTRGLDRFERDVLNQPGAQAVLLLIGINDIGQSTTGNWDYSSASDLILAYQDLIHRAKTRGLKVYLGTLLPFKGAADGYYTPAKDTLRQQVNAWIRNNTEVDGVFDTDHALTDPKDPLALKPDYDSGDHLHPNARGAQAIADTISSSWFKPVTQEPATAN